MEKYLEFFKEIASIPHGSTNTKKISDHIVKFAVERGLTYEQDELNNVIIKKEASKGYEDHESVILQGHMDMVAVKEDGIDKDMTTEGLDLYTEGDLLKAKGTSLGGDDGIAVAYMMDILDGEYEHPALECLFTVDEEIGMEGATGIDVSGIKGKRMINIDNEVEGEFIVGCAGGVRVNLSRTVNKEETQGVRVRISVDGLKGGHSGVEIDKKRGNANKILGDVLCQLKAKGTYNIIDISGGTADNVIPSSAYADIMLTDVSILSGLDDLTLPFGKEEDPDKAQVHVKVLEEKAKEKVLVSEDGETLVEILCKLPDGVTAFDKDNQDFVETSLNLGILRLDGDKLELESLVRSSVEDAKNKLVEELCKLAEKTGFITNLYGNYPGWEYKSDSEIRKVFVEAYEKQYLCKPKIEVIHAGLECGIFAGKIKDLDCISLGPDIKDIHSVNETLSLSSAGRTFELLVSALSQL